MANDSDEFMDTISFKKLLDMDPKTREEYLLHAKIDDWQRYRESEALTFEEFWGDGSDHADTWECSSVESMAEAAWNRSWAIKQAQIEALKDALERTKKELNEEISQSRTLEIPILNWLYERLPREDPQYEEMRELLQRVIPGRHNFPAPQCLICMDMGIVCNNCHRYPHMRSCAMPEAHRITLCPAGCEASEDARRKGRVETNLLERKIRHLRAVLKEAYESARLKNDCGEIMRILKPELE